MKELLRDVDIEGYRLRLYDTGTTTDGTHQRLAYDFTAPGETVPLFEGSDFGASPIHAIDSDETIRSLLCFLTLRPGDTDREYFDDYTMAQLDFTRTDAERLSLYAMDPEDLDEPPAPFQDWTDPDEERQTLEALVRQARYDLVTMLQGSSGYAIDKAADRCNAALYALAYYDACKENSERNRKL